MVVQQRDEYEIGQLISRFANSFDLKAWDNLSLCLADSIYTDYSELRNTLPETMTKEEFVKLRIEALKDLKTHHLASNMEFSLKEKSCDAKVSMVIFRKNEAQEVFNTHCLYYFGFIKIDGAWLINSIKQKVFWSDGLGAIHKGVKIPN